MSFDPVTALEEAGIDNFQVYYSSQVVKVQEQDIPKVAEQLSGKLNTDIVYHEGWLFLGKLPLLADLE